MWVHKPEKAPELVKGGPWGPSKYLITAPFYKRHWYHHQILKERCNRRMYTGRNIHYLPAARCLIPRMPKRWGEDTCSWWLSAGCCVLGALIALNQSLRHQSTLVDGCWWIQLAFGVGHLLPCRGGWWKRVLALQSPASWGEGTPFCAAGEAREQSIQEDGDVWHNPSVIHWNRLHLAHIMGATEVPTWLSLWGAGTCPSSGITPPW